MNVLRVANRTVRLGFLAPCRVENAIKIGDNSCYMQMQHRTISLQSTVDSFAQYQIGLFKMLSESTPVEYCQKFLLALHDSTGLPWWATIVTTTVILRGCVTLPFAVYQNYILAKLETIKLEMDVLAAELKKETSIAVKMYNWDEKTARFMFRRSIRKQWNNLIVRENCHPFKSVLLVFFQIPLWVSLSISLRNLVYMLPYRDAQAQLSFVQLSLGGFGWIPNLTVVDSSLILPVCFGLLNLGIIEMQVLSKAKSPTKFQKYLTNFFRGFSLAMIPIAATVPSCVVLYWTTSSAFGFAQNLVLLSPKIRRFCRIPQTPSEIGQPYSHIITNIKSKF